MQDVFLFFCTPFCKKRHRGRKETKSDTALSTFFVGRMPYNEKSEEGKRVEQTVYGDLLFFINFSMDFLTLYLCAHLLHLPQRTLRAVLAATIGGVYGVASLFFTESALRTVLLNVAVAALMCAIAFMPRRFSQLCKVLFLFYGIGFLLGGSMTAIYHLCNHYLFADRIYQNGNYQTIQGQTSLSLFVLLASVSALLAVCIGRLLFAKGKKKTAELRVVLDGRALCVQALCDSGNLLCDPVSGRYVYFLQYRESRAWLPPPLQAFFADPNLQTLSTLPHTEAKRVRLLYSETVQGKQGLFCLRADRVFVDGEETQALIAIVKTQTQSFGGFAALVAQ